MLSGEFAWKKYIIPLRIVGPRRQNLGQSMNKTRSRSSLACNACRSRHLKCDASRPVCTRCILEESQCVYGKSKRGGNRRQVGNITGLPSGEHALLEGHSNLIGVNRDMSGTAETLASTVVTPLHGDSGAQRASPAQSNQAYALSLYYDNFHGAHPFILPRTSLECRLSTNPESLKHLMPVLGYVGSFYDQGRSSDILHSLAQDSLARACEITPTGFTIQSLLLFAIALHCSDEYELADNYLDRAIDMALSMNMHRREFATAFGEGDPVLEESWRRTYWTLFLMDGLFAAINFRLTHRLRYAEADVDLPCEEHEYKTAAIPTPRTLLQYDSREFELEDSVFSSFTYLIDVGRILSATLGATQNVKDPKDPRLYAVGTRILNWSLHLPDRKASIIDEQHNLDEVLFLAHLLLNTEKLQFHRPYSQLAYSDLELESKCTPPYAQADSSPLPGASTHTAKCLEALDEVAKLLSVSPRHNKHSPIFICALALFTMAQVSACNNLHPQASQTYLDCRDRVRLYMGVIKSHESRWGLARRSLRELKSVARRLLAIDVLPQTETRLIQNNLFSQTEAVPNDLLNYDYFNVGVEIHPGGIPEGLDLENFGMFNQASA